MSLLGEEERAERVSPASAPRAGTVKCWQDKQTHTQIGAAFTSGRSVIARGGSPMGRGRAKAKQTKVARELKYSSPQTDFERLQRELSGTDGDADTNDPWADEDDWRR
jgi:Protein of unknown function (DUF3073)